MIRLGKLVRFTPHEVNEFRQVGLELGNATHQNDMEREVSRWVRTLADERFDLLEKIAMEMAKVRSAKLPPKLSSVCGEAKIMHGPHSVPEFRDGSRATKRFVD
jgi:hypothetical protein